MLEAPTNQRSCGTEGLACLHRSCAGARSSSNARRSYAHPTRTYDYLDPPPRRAAPRVRCCRSSTVQHDPRRTERGGFTPDPTTLSSSSPSYLLTANMPTPESELFLKSKPTVPATFSNVDMKDHDAVVKARDAIIREQWVQIMMKRLVGEELGKCYRKEGVNHLEKCGKYRGKIHVIGQ